MPDNTDSPVPTAQDVAPATTGEEAPTPPPPAPLSPPVVQATSATAWQSGRKEGFLLALPSGNVVRVRRTMDIMDLLRSGKIPNPLMPVVRKMMKESKPGAMPPEVMKELEELDPADFDEKALSEMALFIDEIVARMVLEPKVMVPPDDPGDLGWDPPAGAISVHDLSFEDKAFLFEVSQGGAADLKSFRERQNALVSYVQGGTGVPVPAEHAAQSG